MGGKILYLLCADLGGDRRARTLRLPALNLSGVAPQLPVLNLLPCLPVQAATKQWLTTDLSPRPPWPPRAAPKVDQACQGCRDLTCPLNTRPLLRLPVCTAIDWQGACKVQKGRAKQLLTSSPPSSESDCPSAYCSIQSRVRALSLVAAALSVLPALGAGATGAAGGCSASHLAPPAARLLASSLHHHPSAEPPNHCFAIITAHGSTPAPLVCSLPVEKTSEQCRLTVAPQCCDCSVLECREEQR